jgi:hypothetical protein
MLKACSVGLIYNCLPGLMYVQYSTAQRLYIFSMIIVDILVWGVGWGESFRTYHMGDKYWVFTPLNGVLNGYIDVSILPLGL